MNTKFLASGILSLISGAASFAADINIGSSITWDSDGIIGGQAYTPDDKIHIRTSGNDAIPNVVFNFGEGGETSVAAVVLGWVNGSPSSAGMLTMDSGKLFAGGFTVGLPASSETGVSRDSVLAMNSGTELVISGRDDDHVNFNQLRIASKSGGGDFEGFAPAGSVNMSNAKITFASALAGSGRESVLSLGDAAYSVARLNASGGSVISQDTSVSGSNKFRVRVANGSHSRGYMELSDAGTRLDLSTGAEIESGNGFVIGAGAYSVGVVSVLNGAEISQSVSAPGAMRIILGGGENSSGTLNIRGTGSIVDYSSGGNNEVFYMGVGANSSASLNIADGGEFSNRNDADGRNYSMYIGKSAGSRSSISVEGEGSLFYFKGGKDSRVYLGGQSGATVEASVRGGGRMEIDAKALVVGQNGASGKLTVDNGIVVNKFNDNPDIVIARSSNSTGSVEVKSGGTITDGGSANMTVYLGGEYASNNVSGAKASMSVHGSGSNVTLNGSNSNIIVGFGYGSEADFSLYDGASIKAGTLALASASNSSGTFSMYGGASGTVRDFLMGVSYLNVNVNSGGQSAIASISGVGTELSVTGSFTMGTNASASTGLLSLSLGDGARVSVGGTLSLNYASNVTFKIGANDLVGAAADLAGAASILDVGTFAVGDLDSVKLVVDGSLAYAPELGDFKVFILEYSSSDLTKSQIESLLSVEGFDSGYWDVKNLEWDGNRLFLNLTALNTIPEPGVCAAAFGVLALALAALRRRA